LFHRVQLLKHAWARGGPRAALALAINSVRDLILGQHRLLFAMTGAQAAKTDAHLPDGFVIQSYETWGQIGAALRAVLSENSRYIWWNTQKNLEGGAQFWVGARDGVPVSFAHTRGGDIIGAYFFPMTGTCELISHCVTLPTARGQGYYVHMLRHICQSLGQSGAGRVYIDCTDFNTSSARGIEAAGFHQIGRGVHRRSGALVWYQESPPSVVKLSKSGLE